MVDGECVLSLGQMPLRWNKPETQQPPGVVIDPILSVNSRENNDWKFSPLEFRMLNAKYGPCTLDACASGKNKQLPRYRSRHHSFFKANVRGERIWLFPPFDNVEAFLDKYFHAKRLDPTTSALILLPKWQDRPWWKKTGGLQAVMEYPTGSRIFTASRASTSTHDRRDLGPTHWPVVVFWDPPGLEDPPAENTVEEERIQPIVEGPPGGGQGPRTSGPSRDANLHVGRTYM